MPRGRTQHPASILLIVPQPCRVISEVKPLFQRHGEADKFRYPFLLLGEHLTSRVQVGDQVQVSWRSTLRLEYQEVYNATTWWPARVVQKGAEPDAYEVREKLTSRQGTTDEFALKFEAVGYHFLSPPLEEKSSYLSLLVFSPPNADVWCLGEEGGGGYRAVEGMSKSFVSVS